MCGHYEQKQIAIFFGLFVSSSLSVCKCACILLRLFPLLIFHKHKEESGSFQCLVSALLKPTLLFHSECKETSTHGKCGLKEDLMSVSK